MLRDRLFVIESGRKTPTEAERHAIVPALRRLSVSLEAQAILARFAPEPKWVQQALGRQAREALEGCAH